VVRRPWLEPVVFPHSISSGRRGKQYLENRRVYGFLNDGFRVKTLPRGLRLPLLAKECKCMA